VGAPAISGAELERQLAEGLAERFPGEGGRPRREQETAVYRAAQLEAMGEARLRATLKTVHDDDVEHGHGNFPEAAADETVAVMARRLMLRKLYFSLRRLKPQHWPSQEDMELAYGRGARGRGRRRHSFIAAMLGCHRIRVSGFKQSER
jgi:hypothetical protein